MTIIIILAVLALVLGLIEIFIIPGFGFTGITAIVCAVIDAVLIYNEYGLYWALAAVLAATVFICLLLWYVAKSRSLDKVALHATISSTSATEAQLSVKVGEEGIALTRLALVGNAKFGDKNVEVKSSGAFINPDTPIRVIKVDEATIIVEKK